MVSNVTSLGRNGVHDFILIRASAVILACYSIFLIGFIAFTGQLTFDIWQGLFSSIAMKVFTILALLSVLVHIWIGMWQVFTDYIKCAKLRGVLQFIVVVAAFSYMAAGIIIVWGV